MKDFFVNLTLARWIILLSLLSSIGLGYYGYTLHARRVGLEDALSGERMLALVKIKPGWEADYQGSPAFHEIGCVAEFEEVNWLPNDCYDLRLRGVIRARFTKVVREFPYRACEVELMRSSPYDEDDPLAGMEREALLETTRAAPPV